MSNGKDTLKLFQNYQQDAFLKTSELTRAAWSWAVNDGQLCFLQARDPCQEASRPKGRGARGRVLRPGGVPSTAPESGFGPISVPEEAGGGGGQLCWPWQGRVPLTQPCLLLPTWAKSHPGEGTGAQLLPAPLGLKRPPAIS